MPPPRRRAWTGEDTTRTRGRPPAGREGGKRAPILVPAAGSGPEEAAAMAPLASRLIRSTGESYTSHQQSSPTWSSGPVEKAGVEVERAGSEVDRRCGPQLS
jgi:hypothetical protein